MKIIIKFSPEITIKSRSIRIFFIDILIKNLKIILYKHHKSTSIIRHWDYLEINSHNNYHFLISKILIYIPGIHHILLVKKNNINSLEDIYYHVNSTIDYSKLSKKSFCVRAKRHGNHSFTSQDIERYLGKKICQNVNNTYVNLTKPDETIFLEIKNNYLFTIIKRYAGLGGLPIGTQQESLSLISGGFDSSVASYMLIRRGCKVHYCFFKLNQESLYSIEVYKIVYYLWSQFSYSHKIKFISIDFSEVVNELHNKIKNNYIGIILKRMMIRAASLVASQWKIKSLATGEVLGQVSSQTLHNLNIINTVASPHHIILRPLITYDKEKIITLARKIGTESFSKKIPEYCGIISKKSTTQAKQETIKLLENNFNYTILKKSVSNAHITYVQNLPTKIIQQQNLFHIEVKTKLNLTDIILDIRSENEEKNNPLKINNKIKIKKIPFYKLTDQFPKLDQNKIYLLYCEHGLMSKLQAIHLNQQGFHNVKIYRRL